MINSNSGSSSARSASHAPASVDEILQTLRGSAGPSTHSPDQSLVLNRIVSQLTEVYARVKDRPGAVPLQFASSDELGYSFPMVFAYTVVDSQEDGVEKAVIYVPILLDSLVPPAEPMMMKTPTGDIPVTEPLVVRWSNDQSVPKILTERFLAFLSLPSESTRVIREDAMVIPVRMDLDMDSLASLCDYVIAMVKTGIAVYHHNPTCGMQIDALIHPDLQSNVEYNFNRGHTAWTGFRQSQAADFEATWALGQRPDVRVRMGLHAPSNEITIAAIKGYVDFLQVPVERVLESEELQRASTDPGYLPMVVITDTSIRDYGNYPDSLLTTLLALPLTLPLIDPHSRHWLQIFDTMDIGYEPVRLGRLACNHNPYRPFLGRKYVHGEKQIVDNPQEADNDTRFMIADFADLYCHKSALVALDIELGGPLGWIAAFFIELWKSDWFAENVILKELDAFSNGRFSENWKSQRQPIVIAPPSTILAGFYMDHKHQCRDLRSIDLLSLTEAMGNRLSLATPYLQSLAPGGVGAVELAQVRKILTSIAPNAEFTGYHTRIFINPAFIDTIQHVLWDAGCVARTTGLVPHDTTQSLQFGVDKSYLKPVTNRMFTNPVGGRYRGY